MGHGNTFGRDLENMEEVKKGLYPLSETVAKRLKGYHLKCRGVQVMIKDPAFRQISRQVTLSHPTQLFKEIFEAAVALVDKYWDFTQGIRMLTVTGINLVSAETCEPEQLTLFGADSFEKREKLEKVEAAMDKLKEKYGDAIIYTGTALTKAEGKEKDPSE